MGNSRSCESRSTITAKLILVGGDLREFSWPVKVSLLLHQDSDCFICSSEEMELGEFAAAMADDDVLQPGEIYFELPPGWRNARLQVEEMAALALKTSIALQASKTKSRYDEDDDPIIISCCCCCFRPRQARPAALFREKEMPLLAGDGGDGVAEMERRKGGAGGAKGRKFVAKLSAIVEEY